MVPINRRCPLLMKPPRLPQGFPNYKEKGRAGERDRRVAESPWRKRERGNLRHVTSENPRISIGCLWHSCLQRPSGVNFSTEIRTTAGSQRGGCIYEDGNILAGSKFPFTAAPGAAPRRFEKALFSTVHRVASRKR